MKRIIRELTPPVVWRFGKAAIRSMRRKTPGKSALIVGEERNADWYDQSLLEQEHYRVHYTESNYYFLWCVIADRIMRDGVRSILDIGCGPGQVACLLRDRGVGRYHGVDFSEKRTAQARLVCPEYTFSVEDVLKTDTVNTLDYDAALLMEVLEHLEKDVELLMRIPPGKKCYATVPDFPALAHVRHFKSTDEVRTRYAHLLSDFRIDAIASDAQGGVFYLFEGARI